MLKNKCVEEAAFQASSFCPKGWETTVWRLELFPSYVVRFHTRRSLVAYLLLCCNKAQQLIRTHRLLNYMDDVLRALEAAELSGKEAQVYLALLERPPITGGDLAKQLSIDRTQTYNLLRNLIHKGMATQILKDRKTFFQATSPHNLLNSIEKKEQAIKLVLPELLSIQKREDKSTHVEVLEGKTGLRTFLKTLFESGTKEIMVYGATGKSYEVLFEMPHLAKKTDELGIKGKIITSAENKDHPFTELSNFEFRYVKETTPSSVVIFGEYISFNIFEKKPIFVLVRSKSLVDSHTNYFKYLWNQARKTI